MPSYERRIKEVSGNLKHCSRAPECKGPRLVVNHASTCPDGAMEECDNDQCWEPCQFCVPDHTDVPNRH